MHIIYIYQQISTLYCQISSKDNTTSLHTSLNILYTHVKTTACIVTFLHFILNYTCYIYLYISTSLGVLICQEVTIICKKMSLDSGFMTKKKLSFYTLLRTGLQFPNFSVTIVVIYKVSKIKFLLNIRKVNYVLSPFPCFNSFIAGNLQQQASLPNLQLLFLSINDTCDNTLGNAIKSAVLISSKCN